MLDGAERPEAAEGIKFLAQRATDDRFPYYSAFYAVQAANQAGTDESWNAIARPILDRLIAQQKQDDGGWPASPNGQEPGRVYATSMALLTLTVPYRLLPAYQK